MKIAIIGAGSWGTALAIVLSRKHAIRLWVHRDVYLPDFRLPDSVETTGDLAVAVKDAELVLTVTPSEHCRTIYSGMLAHLQPEMIFVSATKGLEKGSLLRMSEVIEDVVGARFAPRLGVLSGPTFAAEVARGDPAAVVIASKDNALAGTVQSAFSSGRLRLYTNDDVPGVEYAAALKNVIAIGAGICEGLGLGSNTMAALITRGLAEITRLACACGGRRETLAGLAGMGDLVLTCTGALSRNRSVGIQLAQGRPLAEIVSGMRMVAEGVQTTTSALALAKRAGVEMPITAQMQAVLFEGRAPKEALRDLMERSLRGE